MKPRKREEFTQQKELVRRIRLAQPKIWIIHPANERMLPKTKEGGPAFKVASDLRQLGLAKGALDLLIETPTPLCPAGCAIEMKSSTGSLTADQETWLMYYKAIGKPCGVFYHADPATRWLQSLGYWVELDPKGFFPCPGEAG